MTSPRPLYGLVTIWIITQVTDTSVNLLTRGAVNAHQTTSMVANPIPRTSPQDQTPTLTSDSQTVPGGQTQLTQEVSRQRDLVFCAYGSHGHLILAVREIERSRL